MEYGAQDITEEDIASVVDALRRDRVTQGELVQEFEGALGAYLGASHVTVCNSGTAALTLAYEALHLRSGDEIIIPSVTFAATASAAWHLGATVRLADVNPRSGIVDPQSVRRLVNENTKAVVCMDLGGFPSNELRAICDEHHLFLIDDASHSIGSETFGRKIGSDGLADLTTFSFHPVKNMTTIEGGAVATRHAPFKETMDMLRHHGISIGRVIRPGYNFRLSDVQCALGMSQLKRLDANAEKRRALYRRYEANLSMLDGVRMRVSGRDGVCPHLAIVMVNHFDSPTFAPKQRVRELMAEEGIATQLHYLPLQFHPAFRDICPVGAWEYSAHALTLPLYTKMTLDDVDHVCDIFVSALNG